MPREILRQLSRRLHFEQNDFVYDKFIIEAFPQFPEGASVGNLSETLGKKLPCRTSQRRLARLVEQERLAIEGRGLGSR